MDPQAMEHPRGSVTTSAPDNRRGCGKAKASAPQAEVGAGLGPPRGGPGAGVPTAEGGAGSPQPGSGWPPEAAAARRPCPECLQVRGHGSEQAGDRVLPTWVAPPPVPGSPGPPPAAATGPSMLCLPSASSFVARC